METEALTLLATQEGFDKHYNIINDNRQYLIEPAQVALRHLKEYYGIKEQTTIDWQEYFSWLHLVKMPQMSDEDKDTYKKFFNKLARDEQGATAIEYGLIAALIAVAAITAMQSLGNELSTTFSTVSTKMSESNTVA